jgi:hypothetical protein
VKDPGWIEFGNRLLKLRLLSRAACCIYDGNQISIGDNINVARYKAAYLRPDGQSLKDVTQLNADIGYIQYFTHLPAGLVWIYVTGSVLVWIVALRFHHVVGG